MKSGGWGAILDTRPEATRAGKHLQIRQSVLHGGGSSEGNHDSGAAPAYEAASVLLNLPEALGVCHVVQTERSVQSQAGSCCT